MTGAGGSSLLFYGPERGACRAALDATGSTVVPTDTETLSTQVEGVDADCIVAVHDPPSFDAGSFLERVRAVAPSVPVVLTDDDSELVTELLGRRTGAVEPDTDGGTTTDTGLPVATARTDTDRVTRSVRPFRAAFEASPIATVLLDPTGVVTWANARAGALLRTAPSALVGRRYDDWPWVATDAGGEPTTSELPCARVLATGGAVRGSEHVIGPPGGGRRYLSADAAPVRRPDGGIEAVVLTLEDRTGARDRGHGPAVPGLESDVTDRDERERVVREQAERLDVLLDSAPLVVFAVDADGTMTYFEGQGLVRLGLDPGVFVGESVFELYDDDPSIVTAIEQALEGERTRTRASLGGLVFETWYVPSFDADGQPDGVVGVAHDVTAFQEIRSDLERRNERLDAFASLVSHDLRNPLSVATAGLAELERMGVGGRDFDLVRTAHDRMDRLIGDVLALARDPHEAESVRPVVLRALVERSWRMVETDDAELDLRIDHGLLVDAHSDRLGRLFENLFRNAAEHGAAPDRTLTVAVGPLEDGSGFYVEDDGPGIPAERREDVFDAGASEKAYGTGLGLVIVRTVVEAHGWSVRLVDADGGGARFEFGDVRLAERAE